MRSCEFCVNRRKPVVCFVGLGDRRGRLEDIIRESMSRWVNMVDSSVEGVGEARGSSDDPSRQRFGGFSDPSPKSELLVKDP